MKARFLDACLQEIEEALVWYADLDIQIPDRLLSEIHVAVEKLSPFPEAFHMVIAPYRKLRLTKFPYSLFFRVDPHEIVIAAFIHQRSDPSKWMELLSSR